MYFCWVDYRQLSRLVGWGTLGHGDCLYPELDRQSGRCIPRMAYQSTVFQLVPGVKSEVNSEK